jgi:vacuolar-type H+-ATPase subunit I/STV1
MKKLSYIIFALMIPFTHLAFSSETTQTQEINKSTSDMSVKILLPQVSLQNQSNNDISVKSFPDIKLLITQPINWYLILLPIGTIVIVIAGTFITLQQLKLRTEESINTLNQTLDKQIKLSKEEIKLEVLSKNRQAWINTLRDKLSKFIGEASYIMLIQAQEKEEKIEPRHIRESVKKLAELEAKIKLLINPTEENHQILVDLLQQIFRDLNLKKNITNTVNKLVNISQLILKEEWTRVKNLD